jgi:hypothetical protein
VSRSESTQSELAYLGDVRGAKCKDCEKGVVYSSIEQATVHLHGSHLVTPESEESLEVYLLSLPSALDERLKDGYCEVLQICRDKMASILRKLVAIQDGVIDENQEFRDLGRGVPYDLLDSFKLIVAFVCAIPHVLDEIYRYYTEEVHQRMARTLTSSKVEAQMRAISNLGSDAEELIKKAERLFTSPTYSPTEDVSENFRVSVDPRYLSTLIVCNLLKMPVHNRKRTPDLYETYTMNLVGATNVPCKRVIFYGQRMTLGAGISNSSSS